MNVILATFKEHLIGLLAEAEVKRNNTRNTWTMGTSGATDVTGNPTVYLTNGLDRVVVDNNIYLGDIITMCYGRNSVFTLTVFKYNGCERRLDGAEPIHFFPVNVQGRRPSW